MLDEKPSALRLLKASLNVLKSHLYLAIPLALSHLFKLMVVLVILTPLIHTYQTKAATDWLTVLKASGIDLQGPMIYIALMLIYFVLYCVSTLAQSCAFSMSLAIINHQTQVLSRGTKNIVKLFPSILSFCLINKTWGIWRRLVNFITSHETNKNPYNWRIINLLSLGLILDKKQNCFTAAKNSKLIIERNFGANPRFSRLLVKPILGSFLPVLLPLLISSIINTPRALWIGGSLSVVLWALFALFNSSLSLIIHAAFYDLMVNEKCVEGFNSVDLSRGIVATGDVSRTP